MPNDPREFEEREAELQRREQDQERRERFEPPESVHRSVTTITSPRIGYHCTTPKKLARYRATGKILAPVRFWPTKPLADRWCKHTGRSVVLKIRLPGVSYPLPENKPAMWCPSDVSEFDECERGERA